MTRLVMITSGLAACATAAWAQPQATNARFEFEFDRLVVSPASPSVTMTVYAAWNQRHPGDFVFGVGDYDLVASSGEFIAASLVLGMNPPNNQGALNGNRVDGAAIGQVHIPGTIGVLGNPDNPIALAEYVWTTSDFAARAVDFVTENTTTFSVVPGPGGVSISLFPDEFTPGFGVISVVPAPAGAFALLGAGSLLAIPRRRRSA